MTKYTFLWLLLPALFACKGIKTAAILQKGEVAQRMFKTEVPFEFRLGLIIVKVEIEGETYDFVLDTGAPNVISGELAAKLNIAPDVKQKAKDSQGGNSDLGFAELADIAVGGVHFTHTGTAIADLKQSREVACLEIDGFIGANLMKKAVWQFDYQRKMITITHSKNMLDVPAGAKVIPFRQQITGTPLIDIDYGGIVDRNVTFDLGSNGNLASSRKIREGLVRAQQVKASTYGVGNNDSGLFGQAKGDTTDYSIVRTVKFGDIVMENQVVSFTEQKAHTIGTKVFENYRLIIDWGKQEITMIPVREYSFSQLATFGFSPTFSGDGLFVGFLYHDSPADRQGVAIGDRILEVDGKSYRDCTAAQWCAILDGGFLPAEAETCKILLLKAGREQEFVLEKAVVLK